MLEHEGPESEELAEFAELMRGHIEDILGTLDPAELEDRPEWSHNTPDQPFNPQYVPLPLDPGIFGYEELSTEQSDLARSIIYDVFGLTGESLDKSRVRQYISKTSADSAIPGEVKVTVYRSNRPEAQNEFVQELILPDNRTSWMVGPDQDI